MFVPTDKKDPILAGTFNQNMLNLQINLPYFDVFSILSLSLSTWCVSSFTQILFDIFQQYFTVFFNTAFKIFVLFLCLQSQCKQCALFQYRCLLLLYSDTVYFYMFIFHPEIMTNLLLLLAFLVCFYSFPGVFYMNNYVTYRYIFFLLFN